jgi:hypothetical protein
MSLIQLPLRSCSSPVCHPTPCLRDCPYERSKAATRFRRAIRKGQTVGPLPYWAGRWMLLVEGWEPWSIMEQKSD